MTQPAKYKRDPHNEVQRHTVSLLNCSLSFAVHPLPPSTLHPTPPFDCSSFCRSTPISYPSAVIYLHRVRRSYRSTRRLMYEAGGRAKVVRHDRLKEFGWEISKRSVTPSRSEGGLRVPCTLVWSRVVGTPLSAICVKLTTKDRPPLRRWTTSTYCELAKLLPPPQH